jgi:signal transduction histidine kinase
MRDRAEALGGSFDLRSGPAGTTIIVMLPVRDGGIGSAALEEEGSTRDIA